MQLEYYVYGDFQSIVTALHMVANLFSNDTYQSWFSVVILLTITAFAFQANAERIFGAKTSDALWIKRVLIGTVLYSMFMVPTVTLHVYDPVKNKYEAIGGIPAGVGLVAGITSMFTREISELIETAGNPIMHIDDIGFGHGYEMLSALSALGSIGVVQDQNLTRTLLDYFNNCVDQKQAHGELDISGMWKGNGKDLLENILTDYKIFSSMIYRSTGEEQVYCAEASGYINTELRKPDRVNAAFSIFCSRMNYDSSNTQELLQCRQKFNGVYQAFGSTNTVSYNETNIFASAVIAQIFLTDGINGGAERAKEIARSMANASDAVSGAMAADFMPMIQGMVATILISLFVIVALLMYVAPMDAFKFYFGLWIWYVTWILVDVVINIQVQHYAYNVFREIRETGLSLTTMFTIGDSSAQVLGWYGKARWMSMTIASMMTYGIFKFGGGAAFASFAGALGSSYAGNAASQGAAIGSPGGVAGQQEKVRNDLAKVPAETIAGMNSRPLIQSLSTTKMSELGESMGYGSGIGSESSSRGMSAFEFGAEKGGFRAMNEGASVSQYDSLKTEGITSSQIGGTDAYSKIRNINKVETLQENGADAKRAGSADGYTDTGNIKAAEELQKLEKANGLEKGDIVAMSSVNRTTKSAIQPTSVSENGVENLTTDFKGNRLATEGFYKELYVDTDGDGRYLRLENATLNTKDGTVHGYHEGKEVTMKGDFTDSNASDGMISMKPAMTTVRSGSDSQEINRELKTTEIGNKEWKGSQVVSENTFTTKEGVTGTYDGTHTLNIGGQTRTMSGKLEQSGNSFYGKNLIDKETGMSYSIEGTGSRGSDGSVSLTPTLVEGKGTMNTLTTPDGTVIKSASVKTYGENFNDMRMIIEGSTTENGKSMSVTAEAQGKIENGQIVGNFSVLDKKASEMTTVREGEDRQRLNVDKELFDRGLNYGGTFAASLQQDKAAEVAAQPIERAKAASYNAETGTYDLQKYKDVANAHVDAQAKDWASGSSQIMSKNGTIVSEYSMKADGTVGFKVAGSGVQAGLAANRVNQEKTQTELFYGEYIRMNNEAALATDKNGNFNEQVHREVFAAMLHDASRQIQNAGTGADEMQFGISGLYSESVAPTINEIKEMNSAMANVMTGKGASFLNAEPEEKAAMLKGLRTRMGTTPDGSSGLDSIIEKYENQAKEGREQTASPDMPNPFK
jgi:hypothetical protein